MNLNMVEYGQDLTVLSTNTVKKHVDTRLEEPGVMGMSYKCSGYEIEDYFTYTIL